MLDRKVWIAALRDPEAQQACGLLKDASGAMCCLGVGLVAAGEPHHQVHEGSSYLFGSERKWAMPSDAQLQTLGISEALANAFAYCNDEGATFAQIADFLETGDAAALAAMIGGSGINEAEKLAALDAYKPEGN